MLSLSSLKSAAVVAAGLLLAASVHAQGAPAAKPAQPKGRVLVLLSSADTLPLRGGRTEPTGFYLNEFGVPAQRLVEAGYELVLATPQGNRPVVDARSRDPQFFGNSAERMQAVERFVDALPGRNDTLSLKEVLAGGLDRFAGVFIPGGHAPMVDLANNPEVGRILEHFHRNGKPTAAICHGPLALLAAQADPRAFERAKSTDQPAVARQWLYAGYRMTVFSDSEEQVVVEQQFKGGQPLYFPVPGLRAAGGNVSVGRDWTNHVVIDRELITGQNPMSDEALAAAMIGALESRRAVAMRN